MSSEVAYLGYGSLVNLETLRTPYISARRAKLSGWRRTWLSRPAVEGSFSPIEGLAFLSVEPAAGCEIEGLIITDHRSSLPSLDEREALYDRTAIEHQAVSFPDHDPIDQKTDLYVYVAQEAPAGQEARILRSYLDAVMVGYHDHFGEDGVARFVQTTANFDCAIFEDRDQPLYPRAIELSDEQCAMIERHKPVGVS